VTVTVSAIPMLTDNYAWLIRDSVSGELGIVDPAQAAPAIAAIDAGGPAPGGPAPGDPAPRGRLDFIFLTHHHGDHIDGAVELAKRYGAKIVGNAGDAHRLPKLDIEVREGDEVPFGAATARVIDTPGHTLGHIGYYFADGGLLFCGDTMFSMGCGRLFEGTAADMHASLQKFAVLPSETLVCAGHEYTQSNAKFAVSVDPENAALLARAREVSMLRQDGKPTLPVTLGVEIATNPFLRALDAPSLGRLRRLKDNF
jgi:hydroxyacylglutathione hydrolase